MKPMLTMIAASAAIFCAAPASAQYLEPPPGWMAGIHQRYVEMRGRDRILEREINSDAACRRHRMRVIADAKQSFPTPLLQAIDLDGEQFAFLPVV